MKKLVSIILLVVLLFSVSACSASNGNSAEWICSSCGKTATGQFCSNCGAAAPKEETAEQEWVCSSCGKTATGQFCSNCGAARPETSASTEEKEGNSDKNTSSDITTYTYMNDKWNLYVATLISDTLIKIENWDRFDAGIDGDPFSYQYDICLINTENSTEDFCWLDSSHTAFSLTIEDEENYYWDEKKTVVFTLNPSVGESNANEASTVYTYLNDKWDLYVAIPISESLMKIESWDRFDASEDGDPFKYQYDVATISTDTDESSFNFSWIDSGHAAFTVTMQDEENYYWDELCTVSFVLCSDFAETYLQPIIDAKSAIENESPEDEGDDVSGATETPSTPQDTTSSTLTEADGNGSFSDFEEAYEATTNSLTEKFETLLVNTGDSNASFSDNYEEIVQFYDTLITESDNFYASVTEIANSCYLEIAENGATEGYDYWDDATDDVYDSFDDILDDYYDFWDDILDELYDTMDSVLDDDYENNQIDYSTWSDQWATMYEDWSNAWSASYEAWSEAWSNMYEDWSDVWSEFYDDNFDIYSLLYTD